MRDSSQARFQRQVEYKININRQNQIGYTVTNKWYLSIHVLSEADSKKRFGKDSVVKGSNSPYSHIQ